MSSKPHKSSDNSCAAAAVWFTPSRFSVILGFFIFVAYPDVVLGWRTFFFRDFGFFGYPLAFHHRESFWHGEVPLWNPLNNCGLPFLAQWNTLVLYPGSLFYLLLPLSWSLGVYCLLHQFWAGLGMYFLARRWTTNGLAASVAGVAFAFNGLTLNCLMWPNNIAALGWMPWVVLAVERAWRQGGRSLVPAVIVATMQMLCGAPEIILLTWVTLGALWTTQWIAGGLSRGRLLVRVILIGMLVLLMSAVQLLPFLDLLNHSQRGKTYGDSAWAMPVWGWANFFVPLFHCFRGFNSVYWQQEQYWTSSYYTSVGVLALALLAAILVHRCKVWLLATLLCLSVVLAMGDDGFLYASIRKGLPQIGFMRFPIKFVAIAMFAVPLLAAFAIKQISGATRSDALRIRTTALWTWLIFLGIISVIIWSARLHAAKHEDWLLTWRNGLERATFFVLFGATLLAIEGSKKPRSGCLFSLVLLAGIVGDAFTHVPPQNPTFARRIFNPGLLKLSPQPRHGESRAMISPAGNLRLRSFASSDPEKNYIANRLALSVNCNLLDAIPKLDGFYSMYLRESEMLRSFLYESTNTPPAPICDFLNVAHITDPGDFLKLTYRPTYMPLATVGQKPAWVDDSYAFNAIVGTNFSPRVTVYLPLNAEPSTRINYAPQASILSSQFASQRAEIRIDTSEPTMVVIAQNYYHAWKAFMDGRATGLWRANYAFQALVAPAGRHIIELLYRDWKFCWGLAISTTCLTGCLIARRKLGKTMDRQQPEVLSVTAKRKEAQIH